MPYQHPQAVKHSEGRYIYFPDFSLVLFLDLCMYIMYNIIYLKMLSVSTCRWRSYLPESKQGVPLFNNVHLHLFQFVTQVSMSNKHASRTFRTFAG